MKPIGVAGAASHPVKSHVSPDADWPREIDLERGAIDSAGERPGTARHRRRALLGGVRERAAEMAGGVDVAVKARSC